MRFLSTMTFKGDEVLLRRFKLIPEEQMRLVYVAVTRACKTIHLEKSLARRFGVAEYFR